MRWGKKLEPEEPMTRATALAYVDKEPCDHCGFHHLEKRCRRIFSYTLRGGEEEHVEYVPWDSWSKDGMISPEDIQIAMSEET